MRYTDATEARTIDGEDVVVRLAFFDGDSRGNPRPSGSAIYQIDEGSGIGTLRWIAATALGSPRTTSNVAEFVGLHRLLTRMWVRVHVAR
ncbi:hypothetical protein JG687_00014067 [Phytophthora cactorum]|uniref:Uncharacterized protein n=1 Tax=Phytophthora cactorum TaxID=29920 RepID=A0A8T1TX56_9STRA|nr:hypothetical protein JG687_00014067 [Phytophthora cactorum]